MTQCHHSSAGCGRNADATSTAAVLETVERHRGKPGALIAILGDLQTHCGYLSEGALRTVSAALDLSPVDVYGVATFYRGFSLTPRGRHVVCVCEGTACHVRGAPRVVEHLERELAISSGETTSDGEFSLETVNCLGACALGPIVVIDDRYFSNVGTAKARRILRRVRSESSQSTDPPPRADDDPEQQGDDQAAVA